MNYLSYSSISKAIITIIFTSFFIGSTFGQSLESENSEIGQRLDNYLSNAVPYGFSGQILVEKEEQIIFSEAYGFADRYDQISMTKNTMMGIASMSKQFCAAAILKLKDEGKLSLDDTLSIFFQDVPEDKAGITIHQLLTHTSGLNRSQNSDFEVGNKEEMVRDIFKTPLDFKPGTDWRYSVGYSIAALIIEKITGQSYKSFLEEHLFKPTNLQYTTHATGPYNESAVIAHSYVGWKDRGTPTQWPANFRNFGAGDLLSTAEDLQRWISTLESGEILSAESLEQFWSPQIRFENRPVYAYGWFIHEEPGDTVIEHGGDAALGYNGGMFIHKNKDLKIFVLTNARSPGGDYVRHAVTRDIERIVLGEEEEKISWRPESKMADSEQRNNLPGTYELKNGGELHIITDGAYLWIAAEGQSAVNLLIQAGEEEKIQFERANNKTDALLNDLLVQNPDAFKKALTESRIEHLESYESDWKELVNTLGPLQRYKIRGSTLFFDNIETIAKLYFRDASIEMSFLWMDHGRGPIRGTARFDRISYPVTFPVVLTTQGDLIINGLFNQDSMEFKVSGQKPNLYLFDDDQDSEVVISKKGLAGWEK